MRIIQAGMFEPYIRAGGMRPFLAMQMSRWWGGVLPKWDTRGEVAAFVNHSRWIAKCPYCAGALTVGLDEPIFYCVECGMQANGGGPGQPGYAMDVIFPRFWQDIEAVLLLRPDPATRNWLPHETIDDLIQENIAHGVMQGA